MSFFQEAIDLDPKNPNARVYLATAYMMQWIPGADIAGKRAIRHQSQG